MHKGHDNSTHINDITIQYSMGTMLQTDAEQAMSKHGSKLMQNKPWANTDFEDIEKEGDLVRILLAIRYISVQLEVSASI